MPYPELMIAPMRRELTSLGLRELRTPDEVDAFLEENRGRTAMVAINSMCGCAAGSMRPAVALALRHAKVPDALATVFAGQDVEATERVREHIADYPPSSPSIAIFKGGRVVYMLQRHEIQGHRPEEIAAALTRAFDAHGSPAAAEG